MLYIEKDLPNDPELKTRWEEAMKAFNTVQTGASLLAEKIGNGNTNSELSNLKGYFEKFGDEFNKVYDDFKKYGKDLEEKTRKFNTICDSCR